jgi:peptidoglycan/LPS O-acetylase OafA/YrhL
VAHPVWFAFSWSLCVEEQFYWVWPILLALIARRAALFALMAGAIGVDALAEHGMLASIAPAGSLGARVLTSFAAPIGFGSLLALLLDTPTGHALAERWLGRRLIAPLLLGASIGLLLIPATPYLPLSICLAGLVGAVVVTPSHGLRAWLEHPALRLIGTLSYGAYLLHVAALGIVRRALPDFREQAWVIFGLGLPLSLLFAAGAHVLLERPLLALRRSFR